MQGTDVNQAFRDKEPMPTIFARFDGLKREKSPDVIEYERKMDEMLAGFVGKKYKARKTRQVLIDAGLDSKPEVGVSLDAYCDALDELAKIEHLAEIGAATVKAFEELGSPRITGYALDDLVGLKSIEELLQWAKECEQND